MTLTRKRSAPARVLVPLTLGGATAGKLAAVTAQALALDARVTLLHVLEEPEPPPDGPRLAAEAAAASFLGGVAAQLRRGGVGARGRVRYGPVVATVCDVAREQRASIIVAGASEPSGWQRVVGRVPRGAGLAGAISREAPCPVLVVRRIAPPDERAQAA